MKIHGLQKLTLLDFPEHTACTVFTAGCNFRCPFCHNASLVECRGDEISTADFFAFLEKRKGLLDGVAITGGEPLLQPDIKEFIKEIRARGYAVKLDTNGSFPDKLKELLDEKLLDYVAMDVKSSPEEYRIAAGVSVDFEKIKRSMALIRESGTPYEFRTTAVGGIHTAKSLEGVARLMLPQDKWFLQQFVDSGDILGSDVGAFTPDQMRLLASRLQNIAPQLTLRGL